MYDHLVLVIKYRKKVLDDPISIRAKEIFEYIAPKYNITLQEWNHDQDHVHILFKGHPNSELSKFIHAYKSASRSFCLLTTGGAPMEIIKKYMESQGQKAR